MVVQNIIIIPKFDDKIETCRQTIQGLSSNSFTPYFSLRNLPILFLNEFMLLALISFSGCLFHCSITPLAKLYFKTFLFTNRMAPSIRYNVS